MHKIARAILRPFMKPVLRGLAHAFHYARTPDGYTIHVDPRHINPMDYLSLMRGRYEMAEVEILRNHFKPAKTIIEIGANIGYIAHIAMSEKLESGGHYVAVEPNPRAKAPLLANLKAAQRIDISKQFTYVAAAIDAPEMASESSLFIMRPNLSSGLPTHTNGKKVRREVNTNVAITSLSALMKQHAPNGASLICDAEGAEINMVLKDPDAFKNIDQMSIELHEKKVTGRDEIPADVLMGLQRLGFNVAWRVSNTYYLSRAPR